MKNIKCSFLVFSFLTSGFIGTISSKCIEKASSQSKRIDITTFGAIPNDGIDDSDAFRTAMKFCRETPNTTLFIPPGIYNFKDEEASKIEYEAINGQYGEDVQGLLFKVDAPYVKALDMYGCENISVEADGATLMLEGWYETISIVNARNISLKGLTIMHKRPPFTIGTITNVSENYFDMKIDTLRFTYLDDKITGKIHFYDVEKQRIYTGSRHEGKELLDRETIRIYSKVRPKKDDYCILRHSTHYRPAILIKESSGILTENVKIHSQPGMGVVGHRSENITMRNLQIIPEPGSVVSTNTDATHFASCKGNIILDGCKFAGQGDDCTNIHNYYWSVYSGRTNKNVYIAVEKADLHALSLDYPDVGDTIALVSKKNLEPKEYYIAIQVDTTSSSDDMRVNITLDKEMKYDVNEYYMTNITRQPSVEITNNTVRSHMARAYLIKTRNVKISGNVIQSSSGSAIQLGAEASWRESNPVRNILIENNWIIGCGYGHGKQKGTAISVSINGLKVPPVFLNQNIIIRNNVIQAEGENAIYISGAKNVSISGNEISGSVNAIYSENSDSVTVKNNGILPVIINEMNQ